MFLAWKEIIRNKVKFSLVVMVLVMISYLVFLLSGLAGGLMNMNRESIDLWESDAILLNDDANNTIAQSFISESDLPEVDTPSTSIIQTSLIVSNEDQDESVFLFGVEDESFIIPTLESGDMYENPGEVIADASLLEEGFEVGDELSLASSDETLTITGFTESAKYNAAPTLYGTMETVRDINPMYGEDIVSALVIQGDTGNLDINDDLVIMSTEDFINKLPGYSAQNLTLNFMIIFLFVISALVIGIFLYVITLQKRQLFGVLKAQGFTNGMLASSVFAQTFILSLIGTVIGLVLTLVTGMFLPDVVPITFDYVTLGLYAAVLMITALLGGLLSVSSIRKVDPLESIG